MQNISKKLFILLIAGFIQSLSVHAQQANKNYNAGDYKAQPLWIQMMNDPQANYFETIKAFREFWMDRSLPKEPFEEEGMESFEREVGLISDKESERKRERELKERKNEAASQINYASEVRAFKGWMQGVKPWVRADGSIVSTQEQQNIINKQIQEQKEIEIKNGKK